MVFVPHQVSSALYTGISTQLDRLKTALEADRWTFYESHTYLSLSVSIKWYAEHCVVSSLYLNEDFIKLSEEIKDKYFIYDYQTHYRYTLRSQMVDGLYTENNNCLIDKNLIHKDRFKYHKEELFIGRIVKAQRLYIKITEVFPLIDNTFGSFKADTLTVDELIQMRKGEH
ncbi:hypothetical protein BSK59_15590 [Paenibacillus odorifer]|uniref:hypothetical protein n=1 Tax=Paenibacillus odorifer TaxID=189426 RepID=UPI00096FDC2D|nr:hypothetical protein [Paenibacillus odorifer]OME54002.1 hypothetical protein BSK59_15590 [Paenibacillus odorifer]